MPDRSAPRPATHSAPRPLLTGGLLLLAGIVGCSVRAPRVTKTTETGIDAPGGRPGLYYALPRTVLQARISVTRTDVGLTPLGLAVAGFEEAKLVERREAVRKAKKPVEDAAKKVATAEAAVKEAAAVVSGAGEKATEEQKRKLEDALIERSKRLQEQSTQLQAQSDALKSLMDPKDANDVGGWSLRLLGIDLTALIGGRTTFAVKDAAIATRAEADPGQVFHVALDGGALEERSMSLLMTELGLLSGAKFEVIDKTPEVAVKVIKTVGSLVGTIIKGSVAAVSADDRIKGVEGATALPLRALDLAAALSKLREDRAEFLKASKGDGLTDVNKDTWLEVLAEYKRREADILDQFRTTEKVEGKVVVEWRPAECEGCGRVLPILRVSKTKGLQGLVPGVDIPEEFAGTATDARILGLHLEIDPSEQMVAAIPSTPSGPPGERSLHYRIPAVARVRIGWMDGAAPVTPLASELVSIAQLGAVGALPGRLSGSGLAYDAEVYTALGALKKVEVKTKAATGAGDVAEAVGGAVEAGLKADAARTNALREPSNLTQLETYRKELEEQKKIRDLENELGITPPATPAK